MQFEEEITRICEKAKRAARKMGNARPEEKNRFFISLAHMLREKRDYLLDVNQEDVKRARAAGLDEPRIDRLALTDKTIGQMADACIYMAQSPDPVGALDRQWQRPNGMLVGKMRIPLGVICMIYEARPNVTVDTAILCLKAGNAAILRGGSEALQSNLALAQLIAECLVNSGLPDDACQLIPVADHRAVDILCKMDNYIDVLIPRGGEDLVRKVASMATMPVLKHYKGVCHAYIDLSANLDKALAIVINAKTQRPGVCNALEGLLVHEAIADKFLPMLAHQMKDVIFHADDVALPLLGQRVVRLEESDMGREFHSLELTVRIVKDMDGALEYIAKYGSHHTEIICTENYGNAMRFQREVDASMVGVNVSTRFNDGGELGLGAEIGISTSKLHSYGPMGVHELTTTKFVVAGGGQIRL